MIGVARKLGVHWRMVREALRHSVPGYRKKTERTSVKIAPTAALIDSILESDRKIPRKQRHTSQRIFVGYEPRFWAAGRWSGRCGGIWSGAGASLA